MYFQNSTKDYVIPKRNTKQRQRGAYKPSKHSHSRKKQNIGSEEQDNFVESNNVAYSTSTRFYYCSGCSSQFDCILRNGQYVGKVPLILNCKHTLCQECIVTLFQFDKVLCPICKNMSMIHMKDLKENLQRKFLPNFHILGHILWHKTQDSTTLDVGLIPVKPFSEYSAKTEKDEKCCFLNCNKSALLCCPECNDVYCDKCSTIIHKSAKSLWSHKPVPIADAKFSADLNTCYEHNNMIVEFFCLNCQLEACCYCLIEKHTGHGKTHLSKLSDQELLQLSEFKEKCIRNLKNLIITQKKILNIKQCNISNVQKKINEYFVGLYSRLEYLEQSLHKMVVNIQNVKVDKNLQTISVDVQRSIDSLKHILAACNNTKSQKNLRYILKELEVLQNTPCYLLNENKNAEPLAFLTNPVLENIEEYFKIIGSEYNEYILVGPDDLPTDYDNSSYQESHNEIKDSDIESIKLETKEYERMLKLNFPQKKVNLFNSVQTEKIEVTHIESLECFYVQQKKIQYKLIQMNCDIENIAKITSNVDPIRVSVNELYLAIYENKSEKLWTRGRVLEIKNGENGPLYDIFFIDYGNTQTVDITRIKEIPTALAQKKPFAITCELYNPTGVNWSKNAHIHMGKIINGKDVFMLVKKVYSGIHQVDLMVTTSDRGLTSVIDILIHTCNGFYNESFQNVTQKSCEDESFKEENIVLNNYKIFCNSVNFQRKQIEIVTIVNIVDPHTIYVHLSKYADSFKKLMSTMKAYYKTQHTNYVPVEGSFVVVEYRDAIRGNFHRALINQINVNTEEVTVFCVDWGINIIVPWNNVKILTEDFVKLESQAVFVKLVDIGPPKQSCSWTIQASQFLQKYILSQNLKMVVHDTEPLQVALFQVLSTVDICINAQLVQENLADSTGKVSQVLEWPHTNLNQKSSANDDYFLLSLFNTLPDEDSDNDSADEEDTTKFVKQQIDIVKFVSPDLIYLKFLSVQMAEEALYNELRAHYLKNSVKKLECKVDDLCVVLFSSNYYRGKIIDINGNKYKINLYDKAIDVDLTEDHIFEYHSYFKKYPNVTFKAHLANIKPAGGEKWSMASLETVEKVFETYQDIFATRVPGDISSKSMPMKMWYKKVKYRGALEASLITYKCINDLLIKLGYAYKIYTDNSGEDVENIELSTEVKFEGDALDSLHVIEPEEQMSHSHNTSPYHTKEADILDWSPPFRIKEREFSASITCAETEGVLYIMAENLIPVYQDLEKNIKEFFENNEHLSRKNHNWQPGQLCTISSNGLWYRGKIYKVISPNEIVAIMIDYGSDHTVSPKNLYREILYPLIPAFATQIKLDKVYAKSGAWLTSDFEVLLKIIPERARIVIKGSLNVKTPLAEVFSTDNVNINELLVERCPNLTRHILEDTFNSDDEVVLIEKEESIHCSENESTEINLDTTVLSLPQTHVDTTSFKFKEEWTPDENNENKTVLKVVGIMGFDKIVLSKSSESSRNVLVSELLNKIQPFSESQPIIENVKVGMPCICMYSADGLWYRAQVYNNDGLDCGHAIVLFVDFGNIESIGIHKIRMMRPEWFELPISCHIALLNIELKTSNHMEYVYQHIQKLSGKYKICEIISKNPLSIHLYDENGELNYRELVQSGIIRLK